MILHKNISFTPLEQLITFLISRTLLREPEENLKSGLPVNKVPGRDIHLSAELLKVTEQIVVLRNSPKIVCENRSLKKVFRVFRRIFKSRANLRDVTAHFTAQHKVMLFFAFES